LGRTSSPDFPVTPGAFQTALNGDVDGFVTKINPAGTAIEYSTYLGGSTGDFAVGLALDAAKAAYVTGGTSSPDFPTTPGAFDTTWSADIDIFIAKLDPTGSTLEYGTYVGGGGYDDGFDIWVNGAGEAT
jgi:hypothetical protein